MKLVWGIIAALFIINALLPIANSVGQEGNGENVDTTNMSECEGTDNNNNNNIELREILIIPDNRRLIVQRETHRPSDRSNNIIIYLEIGPLAVGMFCIVTMLFVIFYLYT